MYRAAVSSAPGFDPYASLLHECYLGLPQLSREAYEAADPFALVTRLSGSLLIACGTSDQKTWSDAVKMSEALIRAGKCHEFVVLPEQRHSYDSTHDSYFWRKVAGFFGNELSAGPAEIGLDRRRNRATHSDIRCLGDPGHRM